MLPTKQLLGGKGSLRTHPKEVVSHSFKVLFYFNNVCNFYIPFLADFNRKPVFLSGPSFWFLAHILGNLFLLAAAAL